VSPKPTWEIDSQEQKHSKQRHSKLRDNAAILQELHARKNSFYG
jgi:hypothetical protein